MLTGKEAGCTPVSTRDGKYRSGMQGFFAEKFIYLQGHRVISVSTCVGTTDCCRMELPLPLFRVPAGRAGRMLICHII
jgi:hypothetical protein